MSLLVAPFTAQQVYDKLMDMRCKWMSNTQQISMLMIRNGLAESDGSIRVKLHKEDDHTNRKVTFQHIPDGYKKAMERKATQYERRKDIPEAPSLGEDDKEFLPLAPPTPAPEHMDLPELRTGGQKARI